MSALFNDAQKRELADVLVSQGAPRNEADMAVDLALHAQEEAIRTFMDRVKVAPNSTIMLAAFRFGATIAADRFQKMADKSGNLIGLLSLLGGNLDKTAKADRPTQ